MPKFKVKVVQLFKVRREIEVEVEADDRQKAVNEQAEGEAPDFDDPNWRTHWDLQSEKVK